MVTTVLCWIVIELTVLNCFELFDKEEMSPTEVMVDQPGDVWIQELAFFLVEDEEREKMRRQISHKYTSVIKIIDYALTHFYYLILCDVWSSTVTRMTSKDLRAHDTA